MEGHKKVVKKSRVIKVGSEGSWDYYVAKAFKQGFPVAVHFSASWCTPSRAMSHFFEELALEYKGVVFLSVDVDETKDVASKLEIKAMPTFVLMKDGAPNFKLVGANPVELRKRINGFIYG
ncbi:thioredoxin-like protein CXXS1 [Momordica charantia]|uniref:Thioredoxin-like protein CXXS1 n=1 Tax=Momordica charantia TaxID=3673 RepID=A0A6J1CCP8_MOMCH|nr:thioredoxin-like protein CXXS1 [Momordica charantia]XP_022139349.1 thioredoxin-like protein CXXS1 [Momordica charantia]